jgi:tRNA(His) guanylyltransferase
VGIEDMSKDSLGDRMKMYEQISNRFLVKKIPILIRIDGKSFHKWTKGLERPFDVKLKSCMRYATYKLCKDICGARFGYTQSDEISILIIDYQDIKSESWFNYKANKIESISASICTASFNKVCSDILSEHFKRRGPAIFDARAWNLPVEEVSNYILWRERDCERNSISMLAQSYFSHKELMRKKNSEKQNMLMCLKNINWNDIPTEYKRGTSLYKVKKRVKSSQGEAIRNVWVIDKEMPIISKNRNYVERWLKIEPTYNFFSSKKHIIMS